MSVKYQGIKPDRNYSTKDFLDKKIVITRLSRGRNYKNEIYFRAVFRSNGLLGVIRSTCYSNVNNGNFEYAVDVSWGWHEDTCLTTECKTIREAKNILFMWFESKGFSISKEITDNDWKKNHLSFNNTQLKLKL